jgi:hypothetical protein
MLVGTLDTDELSAPDPVVVLRALGGRLNDEAATGEEVMEAAREKDAEPLSMAILAELDDIP